MTSAQPPFPFGPFVNHNHFAGYIEMIAPIPLAMVLRRAVRRELALLYGFAAAMNKPYTLQELRSTLDTIIAGPTCRIH